MSLNDILGNTEVCCQLNTLLSSHRLPHAVVLESTSTDRCFAVAKEIYKEILCSNNESKPCGKCVSCIKVEQGIHPDIYTVKILDKKQAIGIGEIRRMISDCYIKPNEASCKFYTIADKMTVEAQNALLKILEEPPQNVQFVIITQSSASLLQTVLSRSAVFSLDENLTDVKNSRADEIAEEIALAIPKNIELPLLIATGKLLNDKQLTQQVLDSLSVILSKALENKYIASNSPPEYIDGIVRTLRKRSIVKLIEVVAQTQTMLAQNCNMNLLVTWFCANIRRARHTLL